MKEVKLEEIPEGTLVGLQFINDPRWVLITRWSDAFSERYIFAHSKPYTMEKGNIEPRFPDTVSLHLPEDEQTPERLKLEYDSKEKEIPKTKAIDYPLKYILD